jgi:2-methylcitrate dehydratase PrpD
VVVETYDEACRLSARTPASTEEAQFSIPWTLAAMLVDGEVGPQQVAEARLADALLRRVAEKVELAPSAEFTRLHTLIQDHDPNGADPAIVVVEFDDGSRVSSGRVDYPLVTPWSASQIEAKFRRLTNGLLTSESIDRLVGLVWNFDEVRDVSELSAAITEGWTAGGDRHVG